MNLHPSQIRRLPRKNHLAVCHGRNFYVVMIEADMYDFNVTVKADFLYEIIGTKSVKKHDQREGDYMSTVEVKVRFTSWDEVVKYIRTNTDVTVKQVVEMKDMTNAARNQARDTGGYKD